MNFQRMIALFMDYCQSKQLRPKTMKSYEQALQLFARWLRDEMGMLPSFVRRIHFLPQYADGTVGAELFHLQW